MKIRLLSGTFLAFTALYLTLVLILPSDPAVLVRYNISQSRAHMLGLSIAIPIVIIWLFALYGLLKFRQYADIIKDSREGLGFKYLSYGLTVLIFSLPFISSITSYANYLGVHIPRLLPTVTIVKNYLTLVFPFVAFLLIVRGTEQLVSTLKIKKSGQSIPKLGLLLCIVLSALYTWVIASRPTGPKGDSAYFLPTWVVVITLAIPYLYIWCRGGMAAYYLYLYKNQVKGSIYRDALQSLAVGIGSVIVLSIFLQAFITLSARLFSLRLSPLLGIVYVLVMLTGISYGLIARGAKRLIQIEDV